LDVGHRQAIAGELGGIYFDADGGSAPPPTLPGRRPELGELLLDDGEAASKAWRGVVIGGEAEIMMGASAGLTCDRWDFAGRFAGR